MNGRLINTAIGIDDVFAVGRILDRVITVAFGEGGETGAIEVHAIEMDEVRILVGISPAGTEPNLAIFFVDAIDGADDKLAFGDLVRDFSSGDVNEVKMPPAIAF